MKGCSYFGRGSDRKEELPYWIGSLILLLTLISPSEAKASWLIDPAVFHASVHGRTSCVDCHGETLQKPLHPDPVEITKKRSDFFTPEQCSACHDDVLEKLSSNLHGTRQIEDSEKYRNCISCHDPHSQQPVGAEAPRFDPSTPLRRQCGACHENRDVLPALSKEDQSCMTCHSAEVIDDPERVQGLCLHCHGEGEGEARRLTAARLPLIRGPEYETTPHSGVSCSVCHPDSTGFEHDRQKVGDCRQCHLPHPEKVAHDAHMSVSCAACHLEGVRPVKTARSGMVVWERGREPGDISDIHAMAADKRSESSCRRCHMAGNQVGAADMVLPPKSVLCMPCHAATFSVGDTTTILGMTAFFAGFALFLATVLTGAGGRSLILDAFETIFSRRFFRILRSLFLDVFLQRRLWNRSRARWAIHGLIFYPFAFRFLWGLAALIGSAQGVQWGWVWSMLDKNHPLTAFLFDLTGVMLIMGVALAFIRAAWRKDRIPGVPGQDRVALGLIAAVVLVGFLLEGMRIAMTGSPEGSAYAFLGYAISRLFENGSQAITGPYGYVWYVHAVLTGGFIAYIPFSRLLHVIIAPWVLASRNGH